MSTVTVVGAGPSGIHFADALLARGHTVRMLDVGERPSATVHGEQSLEGLKGALDDPVRYFLGEGLESVIQPDHGSEYYGLPPSKAYVFEDPEAVGVDADGFEPLFSGARGGLAQAWTGGCYPFNDAELADFPFDFDAVRPYYEEVAGRIGVTGVEDDLAAFIPMHGGLEPPPELDRHAALLLERYRSVGGRLRGRDRARLGRSRVSVLTGEGRAGREPCAYLGRCLWGCPRKALYTPALTLDELTGHPRFEYLPGRRVLRFGVDDAQRVRSVTWRGPDGGPEQTEPVEILALAAGTLATSRIFLESWKTSRGDVVRLEGLMDNRQVMVPFLTPARVGHAYEPDSYQYNLVAMGLEADSAEEYVHCLITTLKTALVHPVIQSLPLDLRTATWVFRHIRAGLGLVNVNFHDRRRSDCYVELGRGESSGGSRLRIVYRPPEDETARVKVALRRLSRSLRDLGAIVPPGMTRWRPMGASVHYSGTLPMTPEERPLTTDATCRSRDFENLYVVDGSTFPFLPAKNLTFTLMANARRVAAEAFGG